MERQQAEKIRRLADEVWAAAKDPGLSLATRDRLKRASSELHRVASDLARADGG